MGHMPADSFERFMGLGPSRTYQRLADTLGVSKRTVVRRARRDGRQARIAGIAAQAQTKVAELSDDIASVNERHLKSIRLLQARALQGLATMTLRSPMECVRTLDLAIKAERTVLGKNEADRGPTLAELLEQTVKAHPQPPGGSR